MKRDEYTAALERARAEIDQLPEAQRRRVLELFDEALRRQGEILDDSESLDDVALRLGHSVESLRETAQRLQGQLQDMRIAAKLLLLDLEASRREKDGEPTDEGDSDS